MITPVYPSRPFKEGQGGQANNIELMKKVYLAPQTEAIQLLGENAIMAVSVPVGYQLPFGNPGDGGQPR